MRKNIKNKIYVRWLGAFGGSETGLDDALKYELEITREVACEPILGNAGYIRQSAVGLLIDGNNIVREFKGDVWSQLVGDKLIPTRKVFESNYGKSHSEAFANPIYSGLVLKVGLDKLIQPTKEIILNFCKSRGLELFFLNKKGKLIPLKGGVWKF